MLLVDSPNNPHKVLISKYGEVGANEYLDPVGNQVLTFDHFKQEVLGSRVISGELDSEIEPWRSAIQAKAIEYVSGFYDLGAGTVYGSKEGSHFVVTIAISSAIFNSVNFYNGRWRSTWIVKFTPGKKAELEGNIRLNVHYYEEGNVQLNTNFTKKKDGFSATKPEVLSESIISAIKELEAEFQNQLELSYDKMNNTTYKALRRNLPITGTKINWAKISHYKIGSEIEKKT